MDGSAASEMTLTGAPGAVPPGAAALERRAAVVERLRAADRDVARAAAVRLERVNDLRVHAAAADDDPAAGRADAAGAQASVRFRAPSDLQRRSVRAELAAALRISERAAETQLAMAEALAGELSATMVALRAGEITEQHTRILWEHACRLPEEDRAEFERRALEAARVLSPARFAGRLHRIQEHLHPDTAAERHRQAAERRNVWLDPAANGMAYLTALLPAPVAVAAADRIEDYARGSKGDPAEIRTLPQLRADLFTEFLLNGDLGSRNIRPTVHLTLPVLSLLGTSEELAILEGYGPVDLETARTLAADATCFIRLLTHPVTGAILDYDRTRYTPTGEQRDWLRLRDETCRWPGCGRRARHCELDHTAEWAKDAGPTAFDNLAHLCTAHHTLKTSTDWDAEHVDRFGTLQWTSPFGQTYRTHAVVRMRGAPHLADTVSEATLRYDDPPPPEHDDRIPSDLYGLLQAAHDAELAADRANGTLVA